MSFFYSTRERECMLNIYWQSWLYTTPTCLRISSSTSASRRESAWGITALSFNPALNKNMQEHVQCISAPSHQHKHSKLLMIKVLLMPPCVESVYSN